jgi:hypothetical protein
VVVSCAWCGRYCVEGRWVAAQGVRGAGGPAQVGTSHGMCPSCFEALMRLQQSAHPARTKRQPPLERRTGLERRTRVEPVSRDRRRADRRTHERV